MLACFDYHIFPISSASYTQPELECSDWCSSLVAPFTATRAGLTSDILISALRNHEVSGDYSSSKVLLRIRRRVLGLKELFIGGFIVFVPAFMVVLQGDLGTAVTFFPIFAVLSCVAGIRRKHLVVLMVILAIAARPAGFCSGLSEGPH